MSVKVISDTILKSVKTIFLVMNNNDNMNLLMEEAEFKLQFLCESLDHMILSWENRLDVYRNMLEVKI